MSRTHRPATLLALLCLALAAPAAAAAERAAPEGDPAATVLSPDRVIVQWAGGSGRSERTQVRQEAEVTYQADLGDHDFQLVEVGAGQTPGEAVAELETDPAVVLAERDGYNLPTAIPNDPLFGQLWGLRNLGTGIDGFSGAVAGADIDVEGAWIRTVGTPSTIVAVIDSGYRFEHPDLAGVAWTNPGEIAGNGEDDDGNGLADDVHGWDFVGADAESPTPDADPTDDDLISGGHGVHTAGTIGAEGDNGVGITGVAQDVRLMPLRVCSRFGTGNRCPFSADVAAINYAGNMGARVANMSLGGTVKSQAEANALAENPDTLYVIAAGNDGQNNETTHHYPCDFNPAVDASPPVPGAIDNVICVAATDQADGLASFSDYGATSVDLGAPGTQTLSSYPFTTPLDDHFTLDDFSTRWPATGADGGFERTNESPLSSFGMTDAVDAPVASTVRETTSTAVTIPANGGCKLSQTRRVVLATGDHYRYSVLLNGVEQAASEPASTATPGLERRFLELPAAFKAGGSVEVRFRFTTGAAPGPGSGVWLDDIQIECSEAVGQASSYAFLQGTSMATPHVAGAAALLFSQRPAASVAEVRDAILTSTDPLPALSGKTVSGGRLDASAAMDLFDLVAPDPPDLASTVPASPAVDTEPTIFGSAEERSSVALFAGPNCEGAPLRTVGAEQLSGSGIAVSVPANAVSEFSATATDTAASANVSACSAPLVYSTKVAVVGPGEVTSDPLPPQPTPGPTPAATLPLPPPIPTCKVPKLAGKTLGQAKSLLAAAGCRLGKVTKPRPKKGRRAPKLVVKSSAPGAGATTTGAVALTLGPKPNRHHH